MSCTNHANPQQTGYKDDPFVFAIQFGLPLLLMLALLYTALSIVRVRSSTAA